MLDFESYVKNKYGRDIVELALEDLELNDKLLARDTGWAWGVMVGEELRGYLFRPRQRLFWFAPVHHPAYFGAWGSGKSLIGDLMGLYLSTAYPGTRGLIVRNTFPELMDTTVATLFKIFDTFGWEEGKQYHHHVSRQIIYINCTNKRGNKAESEILYRPAQEETGGLEEAVRRFQSMEVDWVFMDEARELQERVVQTLLGRLGRWGKITPQNNIYGPEYYMDHHRKSMMACNPPPVGHHLHKRYVHKQLGDGSQIGEDLAKQHFYVMASTYENKRNLPSDYIMRLEQNYSEEWKRVYLYGEWGYLPPDGYPVYGQVNMDRFLSTKPLKHYPDMPMIRGWDLGPTGIYKACVICQIDPRGVLLVLREVLSDVPGLEEFGRRVLRECNIHYPGATDWKDFADPASFHKSQTDLQSAADILRRMGIQLIEGERDFSVRKDAVTSLLMSGMRDGAPGIFFNSTGCAMLVDGLRGGYFYKKIDEETGISGAKPVKNIYSHVHDGLQYACSRVGFVKPKKERQAMLDKIRKRITNNQRLEKARLRLV